MKKSFRKSLMLLTCAVLINGVSVGIQGNLAYVHASTVKVQSNLTEKKTYHGFELHSKKYIEELQSTAMEFHHTKSGAKLLFLQNEDSNKVFSISFRTPPSDNTGVNHVIEHSVLCGSKNYPVKDPFLLMMKQSLNTHLNAYTTSDHTIYPVSSQNEKDLQNLMSVYLDAVFYPNFYKEPKIFKQEGWRYELPAPEGEITLNGVVYNEMKGVYSSSDRILMQLINESLYPSSIYRFESGGAPEEIPSLTYEQFLNTHKKYYQPSNSYIYLYGDLDIEKTLKFIDDKYLSQFNNQTVDSSIAPQKSLSSRGEKVGEYAVAVGTDTKNMTYLSQNYLVGEGVDYETSMGMAVLSDLLLTSQASPLKKALLENKIGTNSYGIYNSYSLQPTFSIVVENANETDKQKFQQITQDTLKRIVKEGLDQELVRSIFSAYELSLRSLNSNSMKGIAYNNLSIQGWMYSNSPTAYLNMDENLQKIKAQIGNRYFENLIEKYLINNSSQSLVVLKPKPGLEEQKSAELKAKLAQYKAKLSKEQINDLVKQTKELKAWQEAPNSKEALSTIPTLSRADLNPKAEEIPTIEKKENDIKVLYHPLVTNGIGYSRLYFDTSKVPQRQLQYLNLLSQLLGAMDTKQYNYMELANETLNHTGGISFQATSFRSFKNPKKYEPKMIVSMAALSDKQSQAFSVLDEIIHQTQFTNKQRLFEVIQMIRSNMENNINSNGLDIAANRLGAYLSEAGRYQETSMLPFYEFICDIEQNFDAKYDEIAKNLEEVRKQVFNKENLLVGFTGSEKEYGEFAKHFKTFSDKVKNEKLPTQLYTFNNANKNEGLIIPSKVQYVVAGGNFEELGYSYSGKMNVLEKILNTDYLWQQIRVKGGAYGGGVSIGDTSVLFYSYRDPNLKETLDAFAQSAAYLKNFNVSEQDITNFIIGTIAEMDAPSNPDQKGAKADVRYIVGMTQKDVQKNRDEVLSTTAEDIRNYGKMLEEVLKQNYHCVVGGEEQIQKNKGLFTVTKSILKK